MKRRTIHISLTLCPECGAKVPLNWRARHLAKHHPDSSSRPIDFKPYAPIQKARRKAVEPSQALEVHGAVTGRFISHETNIMEVPNGRKYNLNQCPNCGLPLGPVLAYLESINATEGFSEFLKSRASHLHAKLHAKE